MSVIRTSPRAFFLALLPLAVLHVMLMANGVAPTAAKGALPLPDWTLIVFASRLSLDSALLFVGHTRLRSLGLHRRGVYGIMGGFAAAIGYMIAYRLGIMLAEPAPGTVLTTAILPVLVGMLSGFLYAQYAGREIIAPEEEGKAEFPTEPELPAFTYDGPVQVRTSIAATAIAAAVPALVTSVPAVAALMTFLGGSDDFGTFSMWSAQLALPAQVIFSTLFVMFVPALIVVSATHALARALRRTRGTEYALIGAATGAIGSLLLVTLLNGVVFIMLLGAAGGAIMGAIYRRFAGIQPLALPEDVLAEDLSALVPEDHPSRKSHVVIYNG
jgi:hypothetical protein